MKRYYFVFCKDDLMLQRQADGTYTIPFKEEPPTDVKPWTTILNITPLDDIEVKAYSIDTPITDHPDYEMCPLRQSYYKLPHPLYLKAGKCAELLYWDRNTKFCGMCGGHMPHAFPYRHQQALRVMRQGSMATAGYRCYRADSQRRR